jgi:hypothetical protein
MLPYDEYEELITLNKKKESIVFTVMDNPYWFDVSSKSIVTTDEAIKEIAVTTKDLSKRYNDLKRKYDNLLKEKDNKKSFFNIFK